MGSTGLIRFYIYLQFSCHHIYYRKGKKLENFQFSMLKFTISVSNLYMKPIWATFEIFTNDNHHVELSLCQFSETYSIVHIGFQGTKVGYFFSEISKMAYSQTHRFYRPHYSNPIFNVQRQFCPVF